MPCKAKKSSKIRAYLITMANCGVPMDARMSDMAMRALLENQDWEGVIWMFEALPSWGAARDEGHAALLIQVRESPCRAPIQPLSSPYPTPV